jgi:hypothetical protein
MRTVARPKGGATFDLGGSFTPPGDVTRAGGVIERFVSDRALLVDDPFMRLEPMQLISQKWCDMFVPGPGKDEASRSIDH